MVGYNYAFACVCASNQNRSMEAHSLFQQHGLNVMSFGTGSSVKLPGPAADRPNVYAFKTPYTVMHNDLVQQNEALYNQNGVIRMLDRNRQIKVAPERFQESKQRFDIIITFEERVFEAVLDHFNSVQSEVFSATYIINLEVNDTHEDAAFGARAALQLAESLNELPDLDESIFEAVKTFERRSKRSLLFCVHFY